MARIIAIDYGKKRTGLAVTDPLQIIATGLTHIETVNLRSYLKTYCTQEVVEKIIIGLPFSLDGTDTHVTEAVRECIRLLKKDHPKIPIETVDEQYTSKMAVQALIASGVKKKQRQQKGLIDEMAATIMLQAYMGTQI